MVRKAAGEYSKTKEEQLGQAVKAAFDWFSTCYGAITFSRLSPWFYVKEKDLIERFFRSTRSLFSRYFIHSLG